MKRHVALLGFMAAGKSTIGRKLARELACAFFDTDEIVAKAHGPVADIFEREGEATFRRYERDAIAEVLESGGAGVMALGGGALTLAESRALLEHGAYRIFLKTSAEQTLHRLQRSRERRPMLGESPTLARIAELYESRMPYYAASDYMVEAERLSAREILDDILAWLHAKEIVLSP